MYHFTRKKFLEQPLERQHKKCAELVRYLYEKRLKDEEIEADWTLYRQWLSWMNEEKPHDPHLKALANYYHGHLQQARLAKKEHHLLPSIRKGDRLTAAAPWSISLYLDHIRSAHNVGSIIRTTEAFALGTLYFSLHTAFIDHKQVKDASMGAYNWVTCRQNIPLSALPNPIIVLETSEEAHSLYDFIFPETFTLVIGNEEYGCSDEALALADELLEIPLRGRKNSLNVANAFAIVASEIYRQRLRWSSTR